MKVLFLLYFLMGTGEVIEAFEADMTEDIAITAFQTTNFAHSL
jgi:hypothetical protein